MNESVSSSLTAEDTRPTPGQRKAPMPDTLPALNHPLIIDKATILGVLGSTFLILFAILWGGHLGAFANGPSFLIVILGTITITTISFSLHDMAVSARVIARTFVRREYFFPQVVRYLVRLAAITRKKGFLGLQDLIHPIANKDPFLYQSLSMLVDGVPYEDVVRNMERETIAKTQRHRRTIEILRRSAEIAPAMGLIGTLVGLVQMLGQLSDPSTVGPSMAIALLTTLYGAVMANMILTPLASKLEQNSDDEHLLMELYQIAIQSMGKQENPRRLEAALNAMLPAHQRVHLFD